MRLEDKINVALTAVMHDNLDELDRNVLKDDGVRSMLTTYFSEREVRPELLSVIKAPSLMREYLGLSLEERVEIGEFRIKFPGYLVGEGSFRGAGVNLNNNIRQICKKVRFTNEVLELYDFYINNRCDFEVFSLVGKVFNRELKLKAANLYRNIKKNFTSDNDVEEFFKFAAELRPEIINYTSFYKVFMIDAPKQLLRFFDFYLQNRGEGQTFGSWYLTCLLYTSPSPRD